MGNLFASFYITYLIFQSMSTQDNFKVHNVFYSAAPNQLP